MFGRTSRLFKIKPKKDDFSCLECHRLGDGTSCKDHATEYTKKTHKNGTQAKLWMPPEFDGTEAEFARDWGPEVKQLAECCDDPSKPECRTIDATTENTR
jgi:hypothetical protein